MLEEDARSPYVDFAYYKEVYHGIRIPEEEFPHVEIEAEAYVNTVTFDRIKRLEEIPDCVKKAICSAAESIQEYLNSRKGMDAAGGSSGGVPVKSESNDGYSITYITYADAVSDSDCQDSMLRKINRYLAGTGLTYRGWSRKYDCQCGHHNF